MESNLTLSPKCTVSKSGLIFRDDMKFDEWVNLGGKLRFMQGSIMFWIGDWLNYGEHRYGETYSQAMDETSYSYQTLANAKWVSSRVPLSRRRENLSFEHHKEVADLEAEDQDLLLTKAEKERLPTKKFRKLVYQYSLRLNLPELTEKQLEEYQKAHPDFEAVQKTIDRGIEFLEALRTVDIDHLYANARDYLFSHLRDVFGYVSRIMLDHEKQKRLSASMAQEEPVEA